MRALVVVTVVLVLGSSLVGCGSDNSGEGKRERAGASVGWQSQARNGRVCPARIVTLMRQLVSGPAQTPVVPEQFSQAWACLYSRGAPLSAGNSGQTLVAGGRLSEDSLRQILEMVSSLPPRADDPCTEIGGGLMDAVVLVNSTGKTFPMVVSPAPLRLPENCGTVSTPRGYLELGTSDRINRALFAAIGQRFPS